MCFGPRHIVRPPNDTARVPSKPPVLPPTKKKNNNNNKTIGFFSLFSFASVAHAHRETSFFLFFPPDNACRGPSIMAIKEKHGEGNWGWSQGARGQLNADTMTHDELRNATNEVRMTKGTLFYFYIYLFQCYPTLSFFFNNVYLWITLKKKKKKTNHQI